MARNMNKILASKSKYAAKPNRARAPKKVPKRAAAKPKRAPKMVARKAASKPENDPVTPHLIFVGNEMWNMNAINPANFIQPPKIAPELNISVDLHNRGTALAEPRNASFDEDWDKYLLGGIDTETMARAVAYNSVVETADIYGMQKRFEEIQKDRNNLPVPSHVQNQVENFPNSFLKVGLHYLANPDLVDETWTHFDKHGVVIEF